MRCENNEHLDIVTDKRFRKLLKPLTKKEHDSLEQSLLKCGCLEPLVVWKRLLNDKETRKIYSGTCKDDSCRFGRSRREVPLTRWEMGDGRWECGECGYGIAPWVYEYILLDGYHRYKMCKKHGIKFNLCEMDFDGRVEAARWIVDNQPNRRK